MDGYLTLKEAAAQLGYADASALRHAIKNGLRAEKIGNTYVLKREWLDAYIAGGRAVGWKRGRPRGQPRPAKEEQP